MSRSYVWPWGLTLNLCILGLQIYSPIYAATEGFIGANLWPFSDQARYLLVPKALFYEFIPMEESARDEDPETLLLHQVGVSVMGRFW